MLDDVDGMGDGFNEEQWEMLLGLSHVKCLRVGVGWNPS